MTQIAKTVGLGGANDSIDTHYIQSLLNKKLPPAAHRGGKLVEDGNCGKNTKTAIRDFQQFIMKVAHPDSLVHPGKATYLKLIEGVPQAELTKLWNEAVKKHQKNIITSGGAIKHAEQNNKPLPKKLIPRLGEPGMAPAGDYCFPLAELPVTSWHDHPSYFGADRTEEVPRKHAGCDLRVPPGTPVYAIANGKIRKYCPYHFWKGTYALEIEHDNLLVCYTELLATSAVSSKLDILPEIRGGEPVTKGQLIGYVGKMRGMVSTMLHFECYANPKSMTTLTDRSKSGGQYKRRSDLLNPTSLLDAAKLNLPKKTPNLDPRKLAEAINFSIGKKDKK